MTDQTERAEGLGCLTMLGLFALAVVATNLIEHIGGKPAVRWFMLGFLACLVGEIVEDVWKARRSGAAEGEEQ